MAKALPEEQRFAVAVLQRWKKPVTPRSVKNMIGWMRAEGGHFHNTAKYNPLNTTQNMPGSGDTGSQGNISVYRNWDQGVQATVQTLNNGRYGAIAANVNRDPNSFARAVNSTPWGTKSNFSSISNSIGVGNLPASGPVRTAQSAAAPARRDPGAGPSSPASGSPIPTLSPEMGKGLMTLLNKAEAGALQGIMPGEDYSAGLSKITKSLRDQVAVQAKVNSVTPGGNAANAALPLVKQKADPSSSQLINAAREQLGVPYSWGGGGPGGKSRGFGRGASTVGFDCSSLVQYAYSKIGVKLPRVTYDQVKQGTAVNAGNRASWLPGDLVFPHSGHVQMYIGGGKVIEAPRTGGHVQIVPVRSGTPYAVRRIVKGGIR